VSAHAGLGPSIPELLAHGRSGVVLRPNRQQDVSGRMELRCTGCGYGAVVSHVPARCPMCGGATWIEAAPVGPRSRL
jgi:hypothetical protein